MSSSQADNITGFDACLAVAEQIEQYAEAHLFDDADIMMAGIDGRTHRPFARDFITADKTCRRAAIDPWSYWTYEDSIMAMGFYIEGLVYQHELTGRPAPLARARDVWNIARNIYYQSQVHGIGCFLRPYGGYDVMERFNEPLGTDQAGPLFFGAYRLLPHLEPDRRGETVDILVRMLAWYADQGYRYWYYKSLVHEWLPPLHHSSSYFLPALALAANETSAQRWRCDLDFYLHRQLNGGPEYTIAPAFRFGSEIIALRDLLGPERFNAAFTPEKIDQCRREVMADLATYDEPSYLRHDFPEARQPGFKPYVRERLDGPDPLGAPFFRAVHGARCWPRHEISTLAALAGLGVAGAAEKTVELLALRRRVPEDFAHYLFEDYDLMPPEAHIYARSVGIIMMELWRDVWMLRWLLRD